MSYALTLVIGVFLGLVIARFELVSICAQPHLISKKGNEYTHGHRRTMYLINGVWYYVQRGES